MTAHQSSRDGSTHETGPDLRTRPVISKLFTHSQTRSGGRFTDPHVPFDSSRPQHPEASAIWLISSHLQHLPVSLDRTEYNRTEHAGLAQLRSMAPPGSCIPAHPKPDSVLWISSALPCLAWLGSKRGGSAEAEVRLEVGSRDECAGAGAGASIFRKGVHAQGTSASTAMQQQAEGGWGRSPEFRHSREGR